MPNTFTTTAASGSAAGYYADSDDLADFLGDDNRRILSNVDNDDTLIDVDRVQRALDYADAEIDAAFAGGPYTVPLAPVSVVMTRWAVVIAANWLSHGRGDRGKDGKAYNPYTMQVREVYNDMAMYKGGLKQLASATQATDVSAQVAVVSDDDVTESILDDPVPWWRGWW